jgi:hypothetical protein
MAGTMNVECFVGLTAASGQLVVNEQFLVVKQRIERRYSCPFPACPAGHCE